MADQHSTSAKIRSLLERLQKAETQADEEALTRLLTHPARPIVVSFLNAHAVNLAVSNASFADALVASDYLLRDGSGVKLGCRVFHVPAGINLNGTDFIPELFARYTGRRVALIGAQPYWLTRAQEVLRNGGYGFSEFVALDGYRDAREYHDLVRTHRPELIVLGLGMPRQEKLALQLRETMTEIGAPCTIVNGGAIIDFMAGKFPRAPLWVRKAGFEWVFRLAMEPRRLARRYVLGNPLFLARVLLAKFAEPPPSAS